MLVIGEGIDDGKIGVVCEIDDVLLGEGTDDHAMDHSTKDASGVFDRFTASELDFISGEKHRKAAEFADADFERHASTGGGFGENHRPCLTCERLGCVMSALGF